MAGGNTAVLTNPPSGASEHITTHGSDWLWAVFGVMAFSDLVILGWHFVVPRGQRVFHQIAVIILTTASIAYFSMASDLGFANIATEFGAMGYPAGVYRQIWYTRYIDWVVTTPALLLELVLASGLPLSDIITLVFFDLVMIITGLIGALVKSTYKWGFYAFGCAALFYIWWVLVAPARISSAVIGQDFKSTFTRSAALLGFLWLLYPVAWGVADGGNVIAPDSEMVFYGVLDILAKPVFCFYHLYALSRLDLTALQLHSGKFTASAPNAVLVDSEKAARRNVPPNPSGLPTGERTSEATAAAGEGVTRSSDPDTTNPTSRFGFAKRAKGNSADGTGPSGNPAANEAVVPPPRTMAA